MQKPVSKKTKSSIDTQSNEDDIALNFETLREIVKNRKSSLNSFPNHIANFQKRNSVQENFINSIPQTQGSILTSYSPQIYSICVKVLNLEAAVSKSVLMVKLEMSVLDDSLKLENCAWKTLEETKFLLEEKQQESFFLKHSLSGYPDLQQQKFKIAFRVSIDKQKKEDLFKKKVSFVIPLSRLLANVEKAESLFFEQKRKVMKDKRVRVDVFLKCEVL